MQVEGPVTFFLLFATFTAATGVRGRRPWYKPDWRHYVAAELSKKTHQTRWRWPTLNLPGLESANITGCPSCLVPISPPVHPSIAGRHHRQRALNRQKAPSAPNHRKEPVIFFHTRGFHRR